MKNDLSEIIYNKLELDDNKVWVLDKTKKFKYSDGASSEQYLREVLSNAKDISSNSYELEKFIIDWNSEYHLSRKRSQLLRGFNFDKSKKVLEVGCGCGAITRFLGETFDNVVAIEGSLVRAGIAQLRTRDLNNVSIVCAPFQEIQFKEKFDIIFCVGVFEYSNMFVNSSDPYNFILKYFNEILNPGGEVIIAIENQFGLKYFTSSTEDHSNIMFDGLEGYPRLSNKNAKTFGYNELFNLLKNHFNSINYYFPYPDYKLPSCVLSENIFTKARVGELIGNFQHTRFLEKRKQLFDGSFVQLELDKNKMLPFFSNSFLVVACKDETPSSKLEYLGLTYSDSRVEKFQTITKFVEDEFNSITVKKSLANGDKDVKSEFITLRNCESKWIDGLSLHMQIMRRVKEENLTLEELFEPCKIWLNDLKSHSYLKDNVAVLEGKYLDYIWKNSFIKNGDCSYIDLEWEWNKEISLNRMVIKSILEFLNDASLLNDINPILKVNSKKSLIKKIASSLGITLNNDDFKEFTKTELKIAEIVYGKNSAISKYYFNFELTNKAMTTFISYNARLLQKVSRKLKSTVFR